MPGTGVADAGVDYIAVGALTHSGGHATVLRKGSLTGAHGNVRPLSPLVVRGRLRCAAPRRLGNRSCIVRLPG
jgi:hypothetical protein